MAPASNSFDAVLDATADAILQNTALTENFRNAINIESQLKFFCEMAQIDKPISKKILQRHINTYIASIDALLNEQVNHIIHHRRFQKLEASWRGLLYLAEQADEISKIRIQILNISWKQLIKDFERAIDFDQSNIFRKIYSEEFGLAGGKPYGVLLGDYEVRHRMGNGYMLDDMFALQEMSQVAAAAFAPFIVGASPALFGLDSFSQLGLSLNFDATFEQSEYIKWNSFREMPDSRFVGITVPKLLMRQPYAADNYRQDGFVFNEDVSKPDASGYLWGNGCYAYGAVLVRAFSQSSWFSDICGNSSGIDGGGIVNELAIESYATDSLNTIHKITTDTLISDELEKILSDYGFMALCHNKGTQYAAFQSNPSVHKAATYDTDIASINARMSAMFHYVMCTSRFAHYIKILSREKIGSFASANDVQKYLATWLRQYTMNNPDASPEMRAKHPLAEGKVEIKELLGKPGSYSCSIYLKPHMSHDRLISAVKLVTELAEARI